MTRTVKKIAEPEAIPKKRIRSPKLKTASDVRKYLARLIQRVEVSGGGSAVSDAYKKSMIASLLLKSIEVSDLQSRIDAIEESLFSKGDKD
jgi:hypothetical protein